ncbi:ubiquitinyl c19 peptidase [Lentinula edodes]|uniref:Ubiquitinyl c19 peptidase n=1 Tax=Lentinula edodes TaxID=5353 RepID=A0A1Q3EQV5_LENED|nr:ubiquitinyl c19 peptidase [Lentinula edodes]
MTAWTSPIGVPTAEEKETVSTLLAMIGGTEAQTAEVLEVYRRNGGNADKAAEVLLSGGLGASSSGWGDDTGSSSTSMALVPIIKAPRARPNTPEDIPDLVDLTKDDRMAVDDEDFEMKRAIEMSMESAREDLGGELGGDIATNDQEVVMENDQEEVEDLEELIRKDGRPISLRSPTPETIYAALLLQALFHVPQVRNRLTTVSILEESSVSEDSDPLGSNAMVFLTGIFEAAVASQPDPAPLLTFTSAQVDIEPGQREEFKTSQVSNHTYVSLDLSASSGGALGEPFGNDLLTRLARDLSKPVPDIQGGPSGSTNTVITTPSEVVAFVLTSSNSSFSTAASFAVPLYNSSSSMPSSSRFSYPSSLYIDPFLSLNLPLVHSKRVERERLAKEVGEYEELRGKLIGKEYVSSSSTFTAAPAPAADSSDNNSKDQGVLPSLRAALYYYENVANRSEGDDGTELGKEERARVVEETERGLRATLEGIENALKDLDTKISGAKTQMKTLFEGEELKKYQYDLRAVLMQPAPSPNSITQPNTSTSNQTKSNFLKSDKGPFVYVRDIRDDLVISKPDANEKPPKTKARWWKSPASAAARGYVEEVSEEIVLSMAATSVPGPAMFAELVPYMLIYSKSISSTFTTSTTTNSAPATSSPQWPPSIVSSVELNNTLVRRSCNARLISDNTFSRPSPPQLPRDMQLEFEELQKQSENLPNPALSTAPSPPTNVKTEGDINVNPVTGEQGGPKTEPCDILGLLHLYLLSV